MATYTGTQPVKAGYYLNTTAWKLEVVEGKGGVLPGEPTARFVRVPTLGMLVVAPVMALFFVMLIPFFGVAVLLEQGWRKAAPLVARRHAPVEPTVVTADRRPR